MSTVPPPAAVVLSATGAPFAGFWIRVVAALIDGVILFIPNLVLSMIFGTHDAQGVPHISPLGNLIIIAMYFGYFTTLQGGKWQATVGKRLLGIHVMRTDGSSISHLRAFGRYAASILSAIILLIGYIMAGVTREKTALHDLICDTRVVYGKR